MLAYQFMIRAYLASIHLASLWNSKAKKWVAGRRNWEQKLEESLQPNSEYIWVHCSSLGEFEQGRPLIEAISSRTKFKVVLTFFSPSGYEIRKKYPKASVHYLPLDTKSNAQKFLNQVQPKLAIFVKYEFWPNFIDALEKRNIPLYLISGIFRPNQFLFSKSGKFIQKRLRKFSHFFLQDQGSADLLTGIGIQNHTLAGDTRFDQVIHIRESGKPIPQIESFKGDSSLFISGSSWPIDEELMKETLLNSDWKWLIAPHTIDKDRIDSLEKNLGIPCQRYTNPQKNKESKVLILDTIGYLSSAYAYADLVYVGGGFGEGIHNLLEASAHGVPVSFGPNHDKFLEAHDLKKIGAGFSVSDASGFKDWFEEMKDPDMRQKPGKLGQEYVNKKSGGTQIILDSIPLLNTKTKAES